MKTVMRMARSEIQSSNPTMGRSGRWLRQWLCFWVFLAYPAIAQQPAPFIPDLAPLRDEALWPLPGQEVIPLAPGASAEEHAAALRADPLHGPHFVVRNIAGNPQATRVVFLVPQFHRNPLMPIEWTSLGTAIMEVQSNVDVVMSRLAHAHGLRCIGSEGNWLLDMGYPSELRQAAQWHHDLMQRQAQALVALKREPMVESPQEIGDDLAHISHMLAAELRRHVRILDGAGVALSRPAMPDGVHRFGIEDAKLNREALRLLAERRKIDEEIAKLSPESQSPIADAMGEMWLTEIPEYQASVLQPLETAIERADRLRLHLRQAMALDAAEALGRFVALAKHVRGSVIRPDEVEQYTEYYRSVSQNAPLESAAPAADAGVETEVADSNPSSEARTLASVRTLERLEAKRERLQKDYERITFQKREEAAARIVAERMKTKESCALVMGAAHLVGLRDALLRVSGENWGIVTVTPYDFDVGETSMEPSDNASAAP